jgi:hypothetical protein
VKFYVPRPSARDLKMGDGTLVFPTDQGVNDTQSWRKFVVDRDKQSLQSTRRTAIEPRLPGPCILLSRSQRLLSASRGLNNRLAALLARVRSDLPLPPLDPSHHIPLASSPASAQCSTLDVKMMESTWRSTDCTHKPCDLRIGSIDSRFIRQ